MDRVIDKTHMMHGKQRQVWNKQIAVMAHVRGWVMKRQGWLLAMENNHAEVEAPHHVNVETIMDLATRLLEEVIVEDREGWVETHTTISTLVTMEESYTWVLTWLASPKASLMEPYASQMGKCASPAIRMVTHLGTMVTIGCAIAATQILAGDESAKTVTWTKMRLAPSSPVGKYLRASTQTVCLSWS